MKKQTKDPRLLKIRIKSTQRKITINKKNIRQQALRILKIKGQRRAELSILFVGKSYIRRLNKRFRNKDAPTDVLAFSMREGKGLKSPHPEILGDIVICPEIAARAAGTFQTTKEEEMCLYLIHGILHLLGYKDKGQRRRAVMEKEEMRILKKLLKENSNKMSNF